MPAKMKMTLLNGNLNASYVQSPPAVKTANIPSSLKSSMISRIQNLKPGCGGCGRH